MRSNNTSRFGVSGAAWIKRPAGTFPGSRVIPIARTPLLQWRQRVGGLLAAAFTCAIITCALEFAAITLPTLQFVLERLSAHAAGVVRTDEPKVRFRVGTDIFTVPKDYVWAHSGREGSFLKDPNLRLMLPGLTPVRKNEPSLREGPWGGGRLVTLVLIESASTWYDKTLSAVVRESIASGKVRTEDRWSVYFGGPQSGSEVYAPRETQDTDQLIQCSAENAYALSASCLKYSRVTPTTVAQIRFAKSMLNNATQIESEVVTFLRSALENPSTR